MEAVILLFRLAAIAGWGWRIASHPASRERFHRLKNGPQVAAFKRGVAGAWTFKHRVAHAWAVGRRLLRKKRRSTRALAIRR
jgi:hypothetical protein